MPTACGTVSMAWCTRPMAATAAGCGFPARKASLSPLQGGRQSGGARPGADRGKRARNSRAAHQLAHRCGSAIGRAIHLAWGWVMHPAAADAPQPRLELRLRHGSDVWSSGVLDADDCGRVHAGVPCERRGSQVDERGCAGALSDLLFGVIAALAIGRAGGVDRQRKCDQ